MRVTARNLKLGLWLVAAVAFGVVGFFAGRSLRPSDTIVFAFDASAPAYEAPASPAGRSLGGFAGLKETEADEGRVAVSGRVVEIAASAVTIETPWGERTTIRITPQAPLRRLEPGDRDLLQAGASVMLRSQPGSDAAAAVLVLSP